MNVLTVALPSVGNFASLSLLSLFINETVGISLSKGQTSSDAFNLYGTIDSAASNATNAHYLGTIVGGMQPIPTGGADDGGGVETPADLQNRVHLWPHVLIERVSGSNAGNLIIVGDALPIAATVVSVAAPTVVDQFSDLVDLTGYTLDHIRVSTSHQMTASDSFAVYVSNDGSISDSAGCMFIGDIVGGGGTGNTSVVVKGYAYAVLKRLTGTTVGSILAIGTPS